MTYNPEDWKPGDLAWITPTPGHSALTEHNRERELRCLVRRVVSGSRTDGTGRWVEGTLHWVNTKTGSWIRAGATHLIADAERAVAVTQAEAERINNVPIVQGTNLRITVPADSPATFNHAVVWSVDPA